MRALSLSSRATRRPETEANSERIRPAELAIKASAPVTRRRAAGARNWARTRARKSGTKYQRVKAVAEIIVISGERVVSSWYSREMVNVMKKE